MSRLDLRRALALSGAGGLLVLSAVLALPAGAATHVVQTTANNTFSPASLTIDPGDQVTWTNAGGVNHTVTSTSNNWSKDSSIAVPSQSTSHTFDSPGTYTYVCKTHSAGMKGTIVVRRPPGPTPTRTTSSPRPSPSRTSSPRPTSASPTPSVSSGTSSTPPIGPTPSASATPGVPMPSVASPSAGEPGGTSPSPSPSATVPLGGKGVTPSPPTGRERGLPVMLAALFIVGVLVAEVRTVRATGLPGDSR